MRSRWIFTSAAAAAFVALLVVAIGDLRAPRRFNVVILTMESARAEVLSPATMPNVWRLAAEGTRYTQHRAVSGWTAANVVSILSGVSPFVHGVHSRDQHVPSDWPMPLADLARAGWRVAGLQPFMQVEGFQDLGLRVEPGVDLTGWLAQEAKTREPFVLWYHYLNTHLPYSPPPPFRPDWERLLPPGDATARDRVEQVTRLPAIPAGSIDFKPQDLPAIRSLYLADFRAFDAWFADFWSFLERSGLRDTTMVILTTDHGEELLERGHVGHASTTRAGHLHEEIVHLPLVVWWPRSMAHKRPAAVIDAPTDHLDIMPTIFDVLQQRPTWAFTGQSLQAIEGRRPWRAVTSGAGFAEPDPFHIPRFVFSIIDWPWKLHLVREDGRDSHTELFNLDQDPREMHDLAAIQPDTVARLRDELMPSVLTMRVPAPPAPAAAVAGAAPHWIFPRQSGSYHYDDLAGRFRLEWAGPSDRTYRVQYEAGSGLLHLSGEFEVTGTVRDFGTIDRRYWNTWIVPYGRFRLRVGVPGREDEWSEWLELQALP